MLSTIRIKFTDFWKYFNKNDNYFTRLLGKRFNIEISDKPDLLIYSVYGKEFCKYNCLRLCYIAENIRPDFKNCDFAISSDYNNDPRHYRYPIYPGYGNIYDLVRPKNVNDILKVKTKFCCFIVSNSKASERIEFFHKLSKYKKVDSAGRYLNHVGFFLPIEIENKLNFIKEYKFVISFENSSYPGYTTEKIFEPMLMNCIPIYWGNPLINKEFNPKSFINVMDFSNFGEAIRHIIEVDQNDELFKKYLSEPYFHNNIVPEELKEENILNFFEYIFAQKGKIKPVAKISQKYFYYCDRAYNYARKCVGNIKRKITVQ